MLILCMLAGLLHVIQGENYQPSLNESWLLLTQNLGSELQPTLESLAELFEMQLS